MAEVNDSQARKWSLKNSAPCEDEASYLQLSQLHVAAFQGLLMDALHLYNIHKAAIIG